MNSTRSIGGTIPTSLTHWVCTYRLFQLQLFWYLSTRMGPNPFVPFQHAQWVVTYMWLLVDEFNSQYWWNYPHFFWVIEGVIVRTGSSPTIFGIFQLGWAPNPLFLFSTLQWVVTYMWLLVGIQLAVLVELSPFLWDIGAVIVRTGSSSSNYFGIFQLGWALTLSFLSAPQMVVTCITPWMNSTPSIGGTIPISLTHWSRYCTYRLFQLQLFWYLSTRP
jgi:hypothetical protein